MGEFLIILLLTSNTIRFVVVLFF